MMYKTHHGVERVFDRTKMVVEDVIKLIDADAVVPLGTAGKYEYLLFYSPFDDECKIAVTSKGREHLVSVWEANYALPRKVTKPNYMLKKIARERQRKYVINRIAKSPKLYSAKILVYENGKLVFTHDCHQEVPEYDDRVLYIARLRSELSQITGLVEKHRTGRVNYLVSLFEPNGAIRRSYHLNHATVLNRISKPPAETVY